MEKTDSVGADDGSVRDAGEPVDFDTVLHQELHFIEARRARLGDSKGSDGQDSERQDQTPASAKDRAYNASLLGLSFSGGGIRSATFNLGILQALAERGLLRRVDYLSTVSGGGYIGGWLQALLREKRDNPADPDKLPIESVESDLDPTAARDAHAPENHAIGFLRAFSNYLTPRLGFFSADTWALVATYLRNVLLNLSLLVLALAIVLLIPRVFNGAQSWFMDLVRAHGDGAALSIRAVMLLSILLGAVAAWFLGREFGHVGDADPAKPNATGKRAVIFGILVPSLCAAWLLGIGVPLLYEHGNIGLVGIEPQFYMANRWWIVWAFVAALTTLIWVIAGVSARRHWGDERGAIGGRRWFKIAMWGALAGIAAGALTAFVASLLAEQGSSITATTLGVPMTLGLLVLIAFIHTGFASHDFDTLEREWLSRLGGILMIAALGWLAVFGAALFGPFLVELTADWVTNTISAGWIVTTIAGLLAGRNAAGNGSDGIARRLLLAVAPYVFLAGLVVLLSVGVERGLVYFTDGEWSEISNEFSKLDSSNLDDSKAWSAQIAEVQGGNGLALNIEKTNPVEPTFSERLCVYEARQTELSKGWTSAIAIAVLGLLLFAASVRFDVNAFSLHQMYRNRLSRAYLRAAVHACSPDEQAPTGCRYRDPFIGFSSEDDFPLAEAALGLDAESKQSFAIGPYPIVNTAINLVRGRQLAWQERKAAAFALTPCHCGFSKPDDPQGAYRPTKVFAAEGATMLQAGAGGITLGDAMATSGAAASPNMGYHTTAALSALLAIFNVRLGRWIGNPYSRRGNWRYSSPLFAIGYFLREGFGATHARSEFVYLSDGGHFENLGVYELVRRRCRYIIACDGGADGDFTFEDLGNAIRKCRIDLGVDIRVDIAGIRERDERGVSTNPCAVGEIDYGGGQIGTLIYIKASRIAQMSTDIVQYAEYHPDFPHQTTGDQFFSESQFESYRRLGLEIGRRVFDGGGDADRAQGDIRMLFARLREYWIAPSRQTAGSFTRLTATLKALYRELSKRDELAFLDEQFYPEWPALLELTSSAPKSGSSTAAKRAAATPPLKGAALTRRTQDDLVQLLNQMPHDPQQIRAGFYFCNEMIQLMEDAYLDLDLENEWSHPDNSGWMNLFKHWSWSAMFRASWAISAPTYGRRFQRFCIERLDLQLGRVVCQPVRLGDLRAPLNPLERHQLLELTGNRGRFSVYSIRLVTGTSDLFERDVDDESGFVFSIGYALVRNGMLEMYRIQDHLRAMGLGRKGLEALLETLGVSARRRDALRPVAFAELSPYALTIIGADDPRARYDRFHAMFEEVRDSRS